MPGQALGPTRLGPAPWDLALDPAPMEPPRHTLVKDKARTCASFLQHVESEHIRSSLKMSNVRTLGLTGSSNSSKYFASNDSSDTSRKARKSQEALPERQRDFETQVENSLWGKIQRTPECVMMTYQMHAR